MNRREALRSIGGLALGGFTTIQSTGPSGIDLAVRHADSEVIARVKDIMAKTGIWWDVESLAANVDAAEVDVRLAIAAMLRGRSMNVGEGMVVDWQDYEKFYRIAGAQVEA